jgi:hypothetical protein
MEGARGEEEPMKYQCPSKGCRFGTNVSDRLQHHLRETRHDRKPREFRGDRQIPRKAKAK